jgi:predicted methyltransferase
LQSGQAAQIDRNQRISAPKCRKTHPKCRFGSGYVTKTYRQNQAVPQKSGLQPKYAVTQCVFPQPVKPGGSYVIVDHAAAAGSGTSDTQSLHRIDPASVREEVEASGFVLDAVSTILANENDQHSIKVFDPSIKGQTDRFAYRFVKP